MAKRKFKCYDCGNEFDVPYGTGGMGRQMKCPKCGSNNIHRVDSGPGAGRGGTGRGPGRQSTGTI